MVAWIERSFFDAQSTYPARLSRLPCHSRWGTTQERVEHFPDDAQWLLPTSFGNTIRAFEVYPRVMYGVDAIPGWNRLLAVMPEEYAQLVDNEKAIVDFWVNMWLASLLCLVEYVGVALYTHTIVAPLLPPIALALLLFAYLRARSAAVEWGDMFKEDKQGQFSTNTA